MNAPRQARRHRSTFTVFYVTVRDNGRRAEPSSHPGIGSHLEITAKQRMMMKLRSSLTGKVAPGGGFSLQGATFCISLLLPKCDDRERDGKIDFDAVGQIPRAFAQRAGPGPGRVVTGSVTRKPLGERTFLPTGFAGCGSPNGVRLPAEGYFNERVDASKPLGAHLVSLP
ncbi:MAG: hypothetical protein JO356_06735 [Acidobacteria bacterium]|nr:hypothetical protein [Acidobacteriota bacterium]